MDVLSLVALLWLAWGLWRGYRKGLVRVMLNMVALLLGYVAAFIWGWPLSQQLPAFVPPILQWPVAISTVFLGVGLLVYIAGLPLVKRYPPQGRIAVAGAFGNGVVSLAMLATLLWGLNFLVSVSNNPAMSERLRSIGVSEQHKLVQGSSWLVSRVVGLGLGLIGAENSQVAIGVELIAAPSQGMAMLQRVSASAETKQLTGNPELKALMVSGDSAALQNHPDFQAFSQQPEFTQLKALAPGENDEARDAALAETMVMVFQRVDAIKNSPDVQAALADAEVQQLMQQGDSAGLMAHPKMQPIVSAVMGSILAPPGQAPEPEVGKESITLLSSEAEPSSNNVMFKWLDKEGQVHFSTWDRVPKAHREGAELINL